MDETSALLESVPARLASHFRAGEWEAEVCLPTWPRFFRFDDASSGGWVAFRSGKMDDEPLDTSQIVLLDWLIDDEEAIGTAMRDAVLQVMPKMKARFEAAKMGPLPSSDAEVFEMTELLSVFAHHVAGGSALLAVEIHCDWDEHGIGVLWRDGAVLGVSDGDAAINGWLGKHASRGEYDFLYPLDQVD